MKRVGWAGQVTCMEGNQKMRLEFRSVFLNSGDELEGL
jgi:hypothetical protein